MTLSKERKIPCFSSHSEMYFKMKKKALIVLFFLLFSLFSAFFYSDQLHAMNSEKKQDIVDLVLAVVNEEIITLTDLKIFSMIAKYREGQTENYQNGQHSYLEQLIDQKLVLQMTNEDREITDADIQRFKSKLDASERRDEFYKDLSSLGLVYEDLRGYVEEILVYESIITQHFNRAASVSIKEIEQYYQEVYIPRQQAGGLNPKPMFDILNEIETAIKKEKIDKQVEEWIAKLKEEADIEIKHNEFLLNDEKNERNEYD